MQVFHPQQCGQPRDDPLDRFFALRKVKGLKKPPSTSELLDWLSVLVQFGLDPSKLEQTHPFLGLLLKNERDVETARKAR